MPVYSLFNGEFTDVELFASRCYVHLVEEGPEKCSLMLSSLTRIFMFMWFKRVLRSVFFNPKEAPACKRSIIKPIHGMWADNQIDRSEIEDNLSVLPSGKITIPTEYYMAALCCIGITIDDENYPAPDNAPKQEDQQQGNRKGSGYEWKSEGIIFPNKANNLHKYFAFFWNYPK